jgi:hypothetical protein
LCAPQGSDENPIEPSIFRRADEGAHLVPKQ